MLTNKDLGLPEDSKKPQEPTEITQDILYTVYEEKSTRTEGGTIKLTITSWNHLRPVLEKRIYRGGQKGMTKRMGLNLRDIREIITKINDIEAYLTQE